jgi:hypothetical protein
MGNPTAKQIRSLIQSFILAIGKILKDFSPSAAEPLPDDPEEFEAIAKRYEEVGNTVATLARVAMSLAGQLRA